MRWGLAALLALTGCASQAPAPEAIVWHQPTVTVAQANTATAPVPPEPSEGVATRTPAARPAVPRTQVAKPAEEVATRTPDAEPKPAAKPNRSDSEVISAIIARSRASYPGNCGCPNDTDRAGRSCGGRSAYSRAGGRSVVCYPADVTPAMIAREVR